MRSFIEVHNVDTKSPTTINVKSIVYFYPKIYGGLHNSIKGCEIELVDDRVQTIESYEKVKILVSLAAEL